jgi:hypothetical protein
LPKGGRGSSEASRRAHSKRPPRRSRQGRHPLHRWPDLRDRPLTHRERRFRSLQRPFEGRSPRPRRRPMSLRPELGLMRCRADVSAPCRQEWFNKPGAC